jgi:hypothetical protein
MWMHRPATANILSPRYRDVIGAALGAPVRSAAPATPRPSTTSVSATARRYAATIVTATLRAVEQFPAASTAVSTARVATRRQRVLADPAANATFARPWRRVNKRPGPDQARQRGRARRRGANASPVAAPAGGLGGDLIVTRAASEA